MVFIYEILAIGVICTVNCGGFGHLGYIRFTSQFVRALILNQTIPENIEIRPPNDACNEVMIKSRSIPTSVVCVSDNFLAWQRTVVL